MDWLFFNPGGYLEEVIRMIKYIWRDEKNNENTDSILQETPYKYGVRNGDILKRNLEYYVLRNVLVRAL